MTTNKYWLQVDIVCFVFLWFLVTLTYVSWSTSELRMKLALLNMFKTSSIFTDHTKVVLHFNVDSFHVCLDYAFLAFKT